MAGSMLAATKSSQLLISDIGGAAGGVAVAALPCLFETTQSDVAKIQPSNRSAIAKKAETLYVNLSQLIRRVGIERVGFVTLTFPDNCADRIEAQRRFNSFATNFLREQSLEFIAVPERQEREAFHYHLATAFPWDIRTGFDFTALSNAAACKREHYLGGGKWVAGKHEEFKRWERVYFKSANECLRLWWSDLRYTAPRYKFGRCETLPILSNAAALSRYLGAYVTTAAGARLACDKGGRFVRYSLVERAASIRWSWANDNGRVFRRGCQILGTIHELDSVGLKFAYGAKWCWRWRRVINTLGQGYETALIYCSRVPAWADTPSRMGFLRALVHALQKDYVLDVNFLESEGDNPF